MQAEHGLAEPARDIHSLTLADIPGQALVTACVHTATSPVAVPGLH